MLSDPVESESRLYLFPDKALYFGPGMDGSPHAHHAAQLTIGLEGPVSLSTEEGVWKDLRCSLIHSDVCHGIRCGGQHVALLFFARETVACEALLRRYDQATHGPIVEVPLAASTLRSFSQLRRAKPDRESIDNVCRRILNDAVENLGTHTDGMDDRVRRVLALLDRCPEEDTGLTQLAAAVHLSPSRLSHLFKVHTGIALRSYIRWRRLRRAIEALASGGTLMDAAHVAGFSDSAHFTRTFRSVFGLAPSSLFSGEHSVKLVVFQAGHNQASRENTVKRCPGESGD